MRPKDATEEVVLLWGKVSASMRKWPEQVFWALLGTCPAVYRFPWGCCRVLVLSPFLVGPVVLFLCLTMLTLITALGLWILSSSWPFLTTIRARYPHSHLTRRETEAGSEWGIGLPSCMACGRPRRRLSPGLAPHHHRAIRFFSQS